MKKPEQHLIDETDSEVQFYITSLENTLTAKSARLDYLENVLKRMRLAIKDALYKYGGDK